MSSSEALVMRGIEKRFGAVTALAGVDLTVQPGAVHALIGENGAGKSTLMKVLSGALRADAGQMTLFGEPYAPRGPIDAQRRGVAMIYQELNLAPDLTVQQNLLLGNERHRLGLLSPRANRDLVAPVLEALAHPDLEPNRVVRTLNPGAQQLVEIGRALIADARVVVLDEPTSSLSSVEAKKLDEVIAGLIDRGVALVYITHFLEEVMRIAERYTVLRDGETVAEGVITDTTTDELVSHMVGRDLDEVYPEVPHEAGEVVLELDAFSGEKLPRSAKLQLRRGEVLGIAGLVGAGRTELLRALFGLDPVRSGKVVVDGVTDHGRSVRARIQQGLGLVSEDRKAEGLALDRSIAENLTLSHSAPFTRFGWLMRSERAKQTERWVDRLSIRCRDPEQPVRELSGGNQQKVAIARLLHQDADVLLLDEPTRGVDVGSKVEVYRLIGELAAQGKAILMVSSYLPELLGVCDRIAVMHRGSLGEAKAKESWTEHGLLSVATGGHG